MLRVEVCVPAINRTYEFVLNDRMPLPVVIEECAEVIASREHRMWAGSTDDLVLCDASSGVTLPREKTLHQCKVSPGSRLLLV